MKKLVRQIWRLLPGELRRLILRGLTKILSRPLDSQRSLERGPAIVAGFFGTATGLGQSARQMLKQFQDYGLPACASNISRFAIMEDFEAGDLWPASIPPGGIVIFHVNPDMFNLVTKAIGHPHLRGRRIVGQWAWELGTIPQQWIDVLPVVDEVWVPSHFIANALREQAPLKSIHVVPNAIDVASIPIVPAFDPLPQYAGRLLVFFMYDVRSNHARKNPEAVIEAFRQATIGNLQPVLVIKINNDHAWPESLMRVQQASRGLPNVHIMRDKLSPESMKDLLARMDIVISLHRSEGFGFLMAEGMAAAKPVIATGWSGNTDFMSEECSILIDYSLVPVKDPEHVYDKYNAMWAEPDIAQAATALKRLLVDPAERQRLGRAARAHIMRHCSAQKWLETLPETFWQSLPEDISRPSDASKVS